MDTYTPFHERIGWLEGNVRAFVRFRHNEMVLQQLSPTLSLRLNPFTSGHDTTPLPFYQYKRAVNCYSLIVQLQTRTRQLDTQARRVARNWSVDDLRQDKCWYCDEVENEAHIFVKCMQFNTFKRDALTALEKGIKKLAAAHHLSSPSTMAILNIAKLLFCDDPIWPTGKSLYYLGHSPPLPLLLNNLIDLTGVARTKLFTNLGIKFHIAGLYLTGRIWGSRQSKARKERRKLQDSNDPV